MPTPQELAMALRQSGAMSDQDRQMMMANQQMAAQPQAWQGNPMGLNSMGANATNVNAMQQAPQMSQIGNGLSAMKGLTDQEAAYLQSLSR